MFIQIKWNNRRNKQIYYLSELKIPNRAAQNKQRERMRPAGRQFNMFDGNESEPLDHLSLY